MGHEAAFYSQPRRFQWFCRFGNIEHYELVGNAVAFIEVMANEGGHPAKGAGDYVYQRGLHLRCGAYK